MQRARASVVVETIGGVGLLLRLHYDGAWSQRMHRATGHVNHLALINIDPVEQLFRALVMDGLLELSQSNAGLQAHGAMRSRCAGWRAAVPTSSEPNSLLRSRSDRFASGPFATKQLSPVSQASPILSLNL